MYSLKWVLIFMLVAVPVFLLVSDFMVHNATRADSESAVALSSKAAVKSGVLKGSLRDTDIDKTQYSIKFDKSTTREIFDGSVNIRVVEKDGQKGHVTLAAGEGIPGTDINGTGAYPTITGFSKSPPMVALRANVVRESSLRTFLMSILPDSNPVEDPTEGISDEGNRYVIQSQKIAILETRQTE